MWRPEAKVRCLPPSLPLHPFLYNYILVIYFVCVCVYGWACTTEWTRRSEDNWQEGLLSFYHMGPKVWLLPESNLSSPAFYLVFFYWLWLLCAQVHECMHLWGACGTQRTTLQVLAFNLTLNRILCSILQPNWPFLSLPPISPQECWDYRWTTMHLALFLCILGICVRLPGFWGKLSYPLSHLEALTLFWDSLEKHWVHWLSETGCLCCGTSHLHVCLLQPVHCVWVLYVGVV